MVRRTWPNPALPSLLPLCNFGQSDGQGRCPQRFHERRVFSIKVADLIDHRRVSFFSLGGDRKVMLRVFLDSLLSFI